MTLHTVSIHSLPTEILESIIIQAPLLGTTCRRFDAILNQLNISLISQRYGSQGFHYAQALARTKPVSPRLIDKFDWSSKYLDRTSLSWIALYNILGMDWCFFGLNNVRGIDGSRATVVQGKGADGVKGYVVTGNADCWKVGPYWGLETIEVHWLLIKYNTKLAAGKYKVVLQLDAYSYEFLSSIRFRVGTTRDHQEKRFRSNLMEFIPSIPPESGWDAPIIQGGELCIGTVEIDEPKDGEEVWVNIEFSIEEIGLKIIRDVVS